MKTSSPALLSRSTLRRLLTVAGLLTVLFCAAAGARAETTRYVEGSVIVTFKPGAGLAEAKATLGKKSLSFARHFSFLSSKSNKHMGLVRHATKTTAQLIADLKNEPNVEAVEPNYLRWVHTAPNDTGFPNQWSFQNTGQKLNNISGTSGDDIKFVPAWTQARSGSSSVVVGVVDTGVDYVHPDLAPNMWINPGETAGNKRDDDSDGYVDDVYGYDFVDNLSTPYDSGYHGTHVAGTIAAVGNNNLGVIGVDYHAKIMSLRVSSDGDSIDTTAIISAFEYATMMKNKGVNIVALNGSYGGGGSTSAERTAIQTAGNAGIIFCAAAGNETANNDTTPSYPASYRLSNMIVVAASDQNDALASFSNYGATTVDIAAPGTNIYSTQPSTVNVAIGSHTYSTTQFAEAGVTTGLSGVIYDCGIGRPTDFPSGVKGNIALIQRGTLYFSDKVTNAMAAGAVAVLIYNNAAGDISGTLTTPGNWVPTYAMTQADGQAMKATLPAAAVLTPNGLYQYLDGTSMATPHVTGAVAFAAYNFPSDTVAQRIHRVLAAAEAKPGLKNKVVTGGRLNLLRIVDANNNGIPDWLESSNPNAPTITTPITLPGVVQNTAYSQTLAATGGTGPYTWALVNGSSLPDGLTLTADGTLSGTPTTVGATSFAVQVTDSVSVTNGKLLTLTVAATPLAISSTSPLTEGRVQSTYQATLQATGGTTPYAWTVTAGNLPTGLTLSSAGVLGGTPTTPATFQFTVQVADSGGLVQSQDFTVVIDPLPLSITTTAALPTAVVNVAYSKTLAAFGGVQPYTWSVSGGTLPDGLTLDPSGVLSGTPTTAGPYNFDLQVEDSGSRTKTQTFTMAIEPVALAIATVSPLYPAVRGVAYLSQTLQATGGLPPYVWSVGTGTSLPPGLKLSAGGVLSGTPTTAGVYTFTATVTDSLQLAADQSLQLTVTSTYVKPVMDQPVLGTFTIGEPFSYKLTASNYPRSFAVSGLPTGVSYSSTTGIISGRLLRSGSFNVAAHAANPAGSSPTVTAVLNVNPLASGLVGSFSGLITRDPTVNASLGSRLYLSTTIVGSYSLRVTSGGVSRTAVGYLAPTAPQINITLGTGVLALTIDGANNALSGTWGNATVTGYRLTWNAAHPASSRAGYYSMGMDLSGIADQGNNSLPQGSGYAVMTFNTLGSASVSGHVADGTSFSYAGFIGPNGEIAFYAPLYSSLGSLAGGLVLSDSGANVPADNSVSGSLSWSKPATKVRAYAAAFGPLSLGTHGKYLAAKSVGDIILGLPAPGTLNLTFTNGGVAASAVNPNVTGLTFTTRDTVIMPAAGSASNPGKATLSINKSTGAFTGTFTLMETTPLLGRRVSFQGLIIRSDTGTAVGEGYFLLGQIPASPQTILTSPILSGKVVLGP